MFRLKTGTAYIGQPLTAFVRVLPSLRQSSLKYSTTEYSDEQMLGMASILMDEGYGNFERCYQLVRTVRGNMEKARDILS